MRFGWLCIVGLSALAVVGCRDRNGGTDSGTEDGVDSGSSMMGQENTAALCSDGTDNDGNGHTDCNEFSCCSLVSCGTDTACGSRGDGGSASTPCDGPSEPESSPATCRDGCNNDHEVDGFADCFDFDCCAHRSDCPSSTPCGQSSSGMACEGDAVRENTLERCTNGCSDDHRDDTFADCEDFDCCWVLAEAASRGLSVGGEPVEACGAGTICGDDFTVPTSATLCADDDLMGQPVPENSYERCSDGCANDRDQYQDCEDFDCCEIVQRAVEMGVEGAEACGATTQCATDWIEESTLCPDDDATGEPPPEGSTEACTNACDDDRDGHIDCDDFDCCDVEGVTCASDTQCGMR